MKLLRATKHLRAIKKSIAAYGSSRPYKIVRTKGRKKISVAKLPPQQISLLAGETLYQMRSALDHLTFEIIASNPPKTPANWHKRCQFPIRSTTPNGRVPPLPKSEFAAELPGISDKAFTIIEAMQPYYAKTAAHTYLRFLAELSNIDKHRRLSLVRPRVRQKQQIRVEGTVVNGLWRMLDRGGVIEPSNLAAYQHYGKANVKRTYKTLVAFDERGCLGDGTDLPVDFLLQMILYHIEVFVVPELIRLIENP
jgi:hypothetical protein